MEKKLSKKAKQTEIKKNKRPVKELVQEALEGSKKAINKLKQRKEEKPIKDILEKARKQFQTQGKRLKESKIEEKKLKNLEKQLLYPEEAMNQAQGNSNTLEGFIEKAREKDEEIVKRKQKKPIKKEILEKKKKHNTTWKKALEKAIKESEGKLDHARRESYSRFSVRWEEKKNEALKRMKEKINKGKTFKQAFKETFK